MISSGSVSDSKSNSGTSGVETKQLELTQQAHLRYTFKSFFFNASQRKGNYPGEAYEGTGKNDESFVWSYR